MRTKFLSDRWRCVPNAFYKSRSFIIEWHKTEYRRKIYTTGGVGFSQWLQIWQHFGVRLFKGHTKWYRATTVHTFAPGLCKLSSNEALFTVIQPPGGALDIWIKHSVKVYSTSGRFLSLYYCLFYSSFSFVFNENYCIFNNYWIRYEPKVAHFRLQTQHTDTVSALLYNDFIVWPLVLC